MLFWSHKQSQQWFSPEIYKKRKNEKTEEKKVPAYIYIEDVILISSFHVNKLNKRETQKEKYEERLEEDFSKKE